ncbi:MAG: methyltransferase family protein [Candidatus Hodarchaeales archaeon]|jgi:protein-S-isoprenylcysteine O-methyltransferase Ste14
MTDLGDFIWIGYALLLIGISVISFFSAKYKKFECKIIRNGFVLVGAFVGIISFFLVVVNQPRFENIVFNYILGIPIAFFGIIGRIYAAFYLRTKGTTTTLDKVSSVIKSGPYGWVRHPQYATGLLSLIGWFMIWGAIYCILIYPLLTLIVIFQAFIEEKFILEKEFGEGYLEYQKKVGMLFPKISLNGKNSK